jgi:hypothetical protein
MLCESVTNERIFERHPRRMLRLLQRGCLLGSLLTREYGLNGRQSWRINLLYFMLSMASFLVYVIREKEEPKEKGQTTTAPPKSASTSASSPGRNLLTREKEKPKQEAAYIQALVGAAVAKKSNPNTAAAASEVPPPQLKWTFQSIMAKAKNNVKSDCRGPTVHSTESLERRKNVPEVA